jgi:hypothetical protein
LSLSRKGVSAVVVACIGAAAVAAVYWLRPGSVPTPPDEIGTAVPELKRQVEQEEGRAKKVVADYNPAAPGRIDDLATPVAELLRQLPGVVEVEASAPAKKHTHRLVHLRDWHFVPNDLHATGMKSVYRRPLTDSELDLLHEQHLLEVELVQLEQMAVLRCLIKYHGLTKVFSEGFSPAEQDAYREKAAVLRSMEKDAVPRLRGQLADVRKFIGEVSGERKGKAKAIEAELVGMLEQHRHRLLELGAAGRLLIAGELEGVLPLEDAAALEQAKPTAPDGKLKLDTQKVEDRHDAQVRAVMKEGPVAVIILGGAHDLNASLRRLDYRRCEYLRVTTKRYKEMAE